MITDIAQILPPLIREDLIDAGLHHDCKSIDEIHRHARDMYPELFRDDVNPALWNFGENAAPPKTLRRLGWK